MMAGSGVTGHVRADRRPLDPSPRICTGLEVVLAVESDPERDDAARVVSPVYQELQHP